MEKKSKKTIIIGITSLFLVTLILLGLTYAYYRTRIIGNDAETSISVTSKKMEVTYEDGMATLSTEGKIEPGFTATKQFNVKNTGTEQASFSIKLDNVVNGFNKGVEKRGEYFDWKYYLYSGTEENADNLITSGDITFETEQYLLESVSINADEILQYLLKVEYVKLTDIDQSADMGENFSLRVNVDDELSFNDLSEISKKVLSPLNIQYSVSTTRANLEPFFFIPIEPGSTLEVTNNSSDYSIGVQTYATAYDLNHMDDSGWITTGQNKIINVQAANGHITGYNYLGIVVANSNTSTAINIDDIDLSEFVITYQGEDRNLINTLSIYESAYESYSLKEYNVTALNSYIKNIEIVGHGGGSSDSTLGSTMSAIQTGVETEGFKSIEIDVRVTSDNEFVLYHNEKITGMDKTIEKSTLAELKSVKSDLATLGEALVYLSSKNVRVMLDVKAFPDSEETANKLFELIESNNMENRFYFGYCPSNLLKHIPSEYADITYTDYEYETWNSSLIGKNVHYSAPIFELDLDIFVELLEKGHKYFEVFDYADTFTGGHSDYYKQKISIISYLCQQYDVELRFTFYDNLTFDFSSLTEKDIIRRLPKGLWDETNLIF